MIAILGPSTYHSLLYIKTCHALICAHMIKSVIRQKGESQNGGNKKSKHAKFSEKTNFSYPLHTHIETNIS